MASELLNQSSVEKGKRVSSLGKWRSPGWPQAQGFYSDGKKSCSNRSDALFSNPKYPVSAGGSVTAGGKWGKRGGLVSIAETFSFVWGLIEALPAIRESVWARGECGSEIGAGVPTATVTLGPPPSLPWRPGRRTASPGAVRTFRPPAGRRESQWGRGADARTKGTSRRQLWLQRLS